VPEYNNHHNLEKTTTIVVMGRPVIGRSIDHIENVHACCIHWPKNSDVHTGEIDHRYMHVIMCWSLGQ